MNKEERIKLAKRSILGISIGDAFGESFFGETDQMIKDIQNREIPSTSWEFTDDTVMSITIFEQLKKYGTIDQDDLARRFAENHELDPNRGYGATARRILREINDKQDWRIISKSVFEGMGSMGNGASMRVGSIGAYFFDDLEKTKDLAWKSAEITHSNIEGITGAIAVAIGTALATRIQVDKVKMPPENYLKEILTFLPESDTKSKINKSLSLPGSYSIETLKSVLGNGIKILSQDTVPIALWFSAYNLNNFEEALWKGVSVLGDRDTICAIIGGITIMSTREDRIPRKWIESVENWEESEFVK